MVLAADPAQPCAQVNRLYGSMMRPLQVLIVFLTLGGCRSNLSEQETAQLTPAPPEVSQRPIPVTSSPAARSPSTKTKTASSQRNSLIDCVTDPCTINCSKSVAKRSKQKRCVNFKEPVVAKPAVAADGVSKERSKVPENRPASVVNYDGAVQSSEINQNRPASMINYDGAVLHLFDVYAILKVLRPSTRMRNQFFPFRYGGRRNSANRKANRYSQENRACRHEAAIFSSAQPLNRKLSRRCYGYCISSSARSRATSVYFPSHRRQGDHQRQFTEIAPVA